MIKLVYPITPTQNVYDRQNWRKHHKLSKTMMQATIAQSRFLKKPANRIRIHITRYGGAKTDPTNVIAGCKSLIDCLIKVGFIPDDNPDHVEIGTINTEIDKKNMRTEVFIDVLA